MRTDAQIHHTITPKIAKSTNTNRQTWVPPVHSCSLYIYIYIFLISSAIVCTRSFTQYKLHTHIAFHFFVNYCKLFNMSPYYLIELVFCLVCRCGRYFVCCWWPLWLPCATVICMEWTRVACWSAHSMQYIDMAYHQISTDRPCFDNILCYFIFILESFSSHMACAWRLFLSVFLLFLSTFSYCFVSKTGYIKQCGRCGSTRRWDSDPFVMIISYVNVFDNTVYVYICHSNWRKW